MKELHAPDDSYTTLHYVGQSPSFQGWLSLGMCMSDSYYIRSFPKEEDGLLLVMDIRVVLWPTQYLSIGIESLVGGGESNILRSRHASCVD